jgi:hypothetical protein
MIQRMQLEYVTLNNFKQRENVNALLNVFESLQILHPKKWAEDDKPKSKKPYNREALINWIVDCWDMNIPMLFGQKPIAYESFWSMISNRQNPEWKFLNSLIWECEGSLSPEHISTVFDFGSSLANVVRPELACINLVFDHEDLHKLICPLRERDLQTNGVPPIGIRTWMGQHIVKQIGSDRLKNCGAIVRETAWGGIEMDLIEQPWLADLDTLFAAKTQIMSNLEPSGAFGDYSRYPMPLYSPAPNWIPIPLN